MEVNIHKCVFEYEKLIEDAKLTADNRKRHSRNAQAFRRLIQEWEKLKTKEHGDDDK